MSFLTRLSLANRSVVALVAGALILVGLLALPQLKQELLPSSLTMPTVSIVTAYPGATAAQVEQDLTNPLEQSLQGVQGIQRTASTSSAGLSLIVVTYRFGTDLDQAQQQLTSRVNRVQAQLPAGVQPQVQAFDLNASPIIDLAVTSTQDQQALGLALQQVVVPALQSINGVASVNVTGIQQAMITVTLDPQKLQDDGLTVGQVQNALQANNLIWPGGTITARGQTLAVRVEHAFDSLQSIQDLSVGMQGSTLLKLSDVANVRQELAPSSTLTRVNGRPSLGIALTKTSDGNTVTISQALRAQLPDLERKLGYGAHISIVDDQAPLISSTIGELTLEGLLGAGFAILVILVFLLSVRSTLVTAIAIPLLVLIALSVLWSQGYSLNALTLSGLTVAVGRVVDDAIVVLENIYRHLSIERNRHDAVLMGVKEVAGAVTASTLTTVAVFLPLALVGGVVGQQAAPLALAVTIALLASLLVALTVIPVLAYWFLRIPQHGQRSLESSEHVNILERGSIPLIGWVTQHRVVTVFLAVLLLFGSFALFPLIPTNFVNAAPTQHSFAFTLQLVPGTSLEQTDQAARMLADIQQIQLYQATVGTSNAGSSAALGTNTATFRVNTSSQTSTNVVESTVREHLLTLTGLGTVTFEDQANNAIDLTVQAPSEQALSAAAQRVFDAVKTTPHAVDVTDDLAETVPLIDVRVDPAKALMHALTTQQAGQLIQLAEVGAPTTSIVVQGEQQEVELKLAASSDVVQHIQDLLLPTPKGIVRLGDIATVTQVDGPLQIAHTNGTRSATITLIPAEQSDYNAVQSAVQQRMSGLKLLGGASVALGVNAAAAQDTINRLLLALLLAISTI